MLPRSILSCVDFSEHSRHALRWAGAFANRFQSRLTVITVVDPVLAEAASIRLGQDLARAETELALREFVAATWSEDVQAPAQVVIKTTVGESAAAILETATADRADLIMMGTQGLGGFRKWLLGSTTERLLRRTNLPVLAVPLAGQLCAAPGCDDLVIPGHPGEMIGPIAHDRGAQLIVMGLASRGGVFAPRPGSIAYRVLCSSTVPVLVVPIADGLYAALSSSDKLRLRMDCASHASLWEGSTAASGWGGPHTTIQAAVIEWLTNGTYQGFSIGKFRTLADGTTVIG